MNTKRNENKAMGVALLFTGMALFGSATPVSKMVGEDLPVFTASLLRVILGALSLFPFVAGDLRRNFRRMSMQAWREVGLISLFGIVVALLSDVPDENLVRGQVGTIVEELDEGVFEVEFSDDEGRTYAQLPLHRDQLLRLHHRRVEAA